MLCQNFTKLSANILRLLFCSLLTVFGWQHSQAQTLVWQENFDSSGINPNVWTYDFGDGSQRAAGYGWGNSELEYYTSRSQNVYTENGSLVIAALKENFVNSAFTSGRIKTEGRIHFKYGTIEARIKLPSMTNGLWPAFWTLGTVGASWPSIGEIDMMEAGSSAALAAAVGNKRISSAAHWSDSSGNHQYNVQYTDAAVDLSADYHLYKMVWTSQYIKMYLDNVEYYSFDISTDPALTEFHNPHFLLLNVAVGGQYVGIYSAGGITAPLPGKMYVDYVKLYQNPGDTLYIGNNNQKSGNFGVLTETTLVSDSLNYATNATLYYWNNLTNIPNAVPYEGNHLLAVHANSGDWFGMGVSNNYVNLNGFATGSLKFHFKTSYAGQFKIGLNTGHGETWLNFAAGATNYGLVRDGNWHEITIPIADFNNPSIGDNIDLFSVKGAFMFAGDPAISAADFYFDNIYFTGGILQNPAPTVAITSPTANTIFNTPNSITIAANASASGSVSKVDFYNGSTLIGTATTGPYSFVWNNPANGVDSLIAKVTDNLGAVTTSASVVVFVSKANNIAPSINITSPANNASFLAPATVSIASNATDTDGSIYKVDYYNGSTLLGTSTTSPFSFSWANVVAGNYTITAKATDNGGLATTSSLVNIVVTNPIKPTVSITSPSNNANFVPPATIVITATAAEVNGTITQVAFYNGTTLLGTATSSPYSFNWANVPIGNYIITAVATDNNGNTTTSDAITITVAKVPCVGTAVSGDYSYEVYTDLGTVYFKFHPLSPITGCTSAIIYVRPGTSGAYPGYNMTASGSEFIYSQAIANGINTSFYFSYNVPAGGERNSSTDPHSYVVGTQCVAGAPSVSISSPIDASSFTAPASVVITAVASAASNNTISKVDFYNGTTLLGSSTTSPYTFTWSSVAAGSYPLTAKATDNNGLSTTSAIVNIVVNAPNTDGYCGTATNGDYEYKAVTVGNVVTFTMHPLTPIVGCTYALIYVREGLTGGYPGYAMSASGSDFIFTKTITSGTPVSFYFTYQTPPAGERNSSASPHSYTIGDNCTGIAGTPPTVTITSPANNATYTEPANITITAGAADATGTISKVEFYNGATLIGTATSSPYTYNWNSVAAGNYSLTAKATDNNTLSTISSEVKISVSLDNSTGFCATAANGDYSYKAETNNGNVTFTFHPLTPILGSSSALIYIREGASGGYPGYNMTAVGPDFRFTKAIANGTVCSIYFTYGVPSGGERNSSASPHSYTVGTICLTTLPVVLSDYHVALINPSTVAIDWATVNEINNNYFTVERSIDGRNFTTIATIFANGNSSSIKNYQVKDNTPAIGINYYRLTQVDKDGKATVFDIKSIVVGGATTSMRVFPNPVTNNQLQIVLSSINTTSLRVQIMSVQGQTIFNNVLPCLAGTINVQFPSTMIKGLYLLRVDGFSPVKLLVQ